MMDVPREQARAQQAGLGRWRVLTAGVGLWVCRPKRLWEPSAQSKGVVFTGGDGASVPRAVE